MSIAAVAAVARRVVSPAARPPVVYRALSGYLERLRRAGYVDYQLNESAIDDSALYQALHRLEAKKLVVGEWGVSENNRRARYYELTPAGRAHLGAASAQMVSYAKTITNLLTVAAKPR